VILRDLRVITMQGSSCFLDKMYISNRPDPRKLSGGVATLTFQESGSEVDASIAIPTVAPALDVTRY
jgi:hypothetical protein